MDLQFTSFDCIKGEKGEFVRAESDNGTSITLTRDWAEIQNDEEINAAWGPIFRTLIEPELEELDLAKDPAESEVGPTIPIEQATDRLLKSGLVGSGDRRAETRAQAVLEYLIAEGVFQTYEGDLELLPQRQEINKESPNRNRTVKLAFKNRSLTTIYQRQLEQHSDKINQILEKDGSKSIEHRSDPEELRNLLAEIEGLLDDLGRKQQRLEMYIEIIRSLPEELPKQMTNQLLGFQVELENLKSTFGGLEETDVERDNKGIENKNTDDVIDIGSIKRKVSGAADVTRYLETGLNFSEPVEEMGPEAVYGIDDQKELHESEEPVKSCDENKSGAIETTNKSSDLIGTPSQPDKRKDEGIDNGDTS